MATLPPSSIPLWSGPAPHSQGTEEKDTPYLIPYLPEKAEGPTPAIVVVPGGAYQGWAVAHEGYTVAEWFRDHGFAAFVLRYRLPADSPAYRHPVPLLDAQRAIRLVRSRAKEWNVNPDKLGIIGFSAGGHLASTTLTHFDGGNPLAADPVDRPASKPDFAVLVYAVISLHDDEITHKGSKANLLGPEPDPAVAKRLSSEYHVGPDTPPTLLVHAIDDAGVPVEHSRRMHAALGKAGIPTDLHEYPAGGHGFGYGINPYYGQVDHAPPGWLDRVHGWLKGQGFSA